MNLNDWLFVPGVLMILIACNTDCMAAIIGFGIASFVLLFFSFKENRNPKRLKRLWLLAKKGHPQW